MRERARRRGRAVPAVFVDRDGTLNREVSYLSAVRQLRLLPGTADAVRRLRAAGFAVVVVTNQSGVARGLIDTEILDDIHAELGRRLAARGTRLDGLYTCPHHPDVGRPPFRRRCRCRKPAPGLVRRAARELNLDLRRSYCVGDGPGDLALAAAVGARGVLVLSGHGRETARAVLGRGRGREPLHAAANRQCRRGPGPFAPTAAVAHVAPNFHAAAKWIIDDADRRRWMRRRR